MSSQLHGLEGRRFTLKSTHWSGRSHYRSLSAGHVEWGPCNLFQPLRELLTGIPPQLLELVPSLQCVDLKVEGFAPSLGVTIDL
jgi:hypothetical protein